MKGRRHYIGDRLRHLRTDPTPEISVERIADIAGVPVQEWLSYEEAGVVPDAHIWKRLQGAGFDICYVLTGEYLDTTRLNPDDYLLLSQFRRLDPTAREALCHLASSCATADQIRGSHPLTERRREEAVHSLYQFGQAVGAVVHNNTGHIRVYMTGQPVE